MTEFNPCNLYKEVYGLGDPVVMLHGWAMHTGVWRTFAQALAENHQVICMDLPGYGRSTGVMGNTLESMVDTIARELPEQACVIVGWSLGGNVALGLAEKYPQRIKSLVLLACNPHFIKTASWPGVSLQVLNEFANNVKKNSTQALLRFMSLQVQGRPDTKVSLKQIKSALQECAVPTLEVLLAGLSVLQTVDQRKALSRLKISVLVILGSQDSLLPLSVGKYCQAIQPQLDLTVVEGAGHAPFLTNQRQVLAVLHDFILRSNA